MFGYGKKKKQEIAIKYYQIPKDCKSDYAEAVLDKPVKKIQPIDICQRNPKAKKLGLALGWGMTGHGQKAQDKKLRRAKAGKAGMAEKVGKAGMAGKTGKEEWQER